MVKVVSNSTRNVFPVVDSQKRLLGLIWLDDIRDTMFKTEFYTSVIAQDLMVKPRELVMHSDPMDIVMQKFDNTGNWVLPVVDEGIYEGFISKSNVFSGYREKLKVSTIE